MTSKTYHIAQYNIARSLGDLDDPLMHGFVSQLSHINTLSDRSQGFVWRLLTAKGDATDIRPYEDKEILVTLSVWQSVEDLRRFVYGSEHAILLRQRKEWFTEAEEVSLVLWWVDEGHIPSVAEGVDRLEYLRRHGSSQRAFTFDSIFSPPAE
jgi:Domain of unknown function (DUF3291)